MDCLGRAAETFSGRRASQMDEELAGFLALLREEGVKSYGEIGAREGDTFHRVMMALGPGTRGVALDLPGGLWGSATTRPGLERVVDDLVQRDRKASCLFGSSRTLATQRVFVARGPYDAILIDGDHTLTGVTSDWEFCRGLARIVALHDIVGTGEIDKPSKTPVDVPLLWSAIERSGLRTRSFVAPGSKMGIGVVWTV